MSQSVSPPLSGLAPQIESLRDIGRRFYARGWSVGTSSNYSVVSEREPLELLVTASGMHKGQLRENDFVRIGEDGEPVVAGQPRSSAETLLHVAIASHPRLRSNVGSVLHTHSIWGTLLSDLDFHADTGEGTVQISGYEMLKGLDGIKTHETTVGIRVFDNTQDIGGLAAKLTRLLDEDDPNLRHGFLMRGHGLYTWGATVDDARRHVEVLEFLFEVVGRRRTLAGTPGAPAR